MKHLTLTIAVILAFLCPLAAQYTTITLDDNKNYFNDGQPLVAEKSMMFTGVVPEGIRMIEVNIFPHKDKDNRSALLTSVWTMPTTGESPNFALPVNFKLRSTDKYDFTFDYFRSLNTNEKAVVTEEIRANIMAYLDVNLTGDKSIKLLKNSKKTVEGMNEIVENALMKYRATGATAKTNFSDIVDLKLQRLEDEKLSKGFSKKDSTTTLSEVREGARMSVVADLKDQINREIDQITGGEWLVLNKTRFIDDYETESKQNFLSVSFGYGGAYLSGKVSEDFDYGSSPFIGLSVPLGNSTFAPKVLSNASFTLGAFTRNFENNDGREITGVLFSRPWFAGLDYKLFQFIRFTGGATFLQGVAGDGSKNEVSVRPFIGVGARINLNFSLEK